MGIILSIIKDRLEKLFKEEPARLLMLGLDAAGKTTVLFRFKLGETVTTCPTIGFNVESVKYKGLDLTMWDVGGQKLLRRLWRHYYANVTALIYIVDSSDVERLPEANEELAHLLSQDELRECPLLVYANKQDLPNAVAPDDLIKHLSLDQQRRRVWHVQGAQATSGDGLFEGLDKLYASITEERKSGRLST